MPRFAYQLAEALHMTVGRLNAEMTRTEFIGWKAHYALRQMDAEIAKG